MIQTKVKHVEDLVQAVDEKFDCKESQKSIAITESFATSLKLDATVSSVKPKDIKKTILNIILSNIGERATGDITMDASTSNIGLDSIAFIKIVVLLESEFDIEFEDDMLSINEFPTIKTIFEYIESIIRYT